MLNRLAIHIADIQTPIRSVDEIRRAEPRIGGGDELDVLIRSLRGRDDASLLDRLAMDHVAADITYECVSAELRRIGIAAVDRHSSGRREEADRHQLGQRQSLLHLWVIGTTTSSHNPPRLGGAFAKNRSGSPLDGDRFDRLGSSDAAQAIQGLDGPDHLLDVVAVAAHKPLAPVVKAVAELLSTGDEFELSCAGIKA